MIARGRSVSLTACAGLAALALLSGCARRRPVGRLEVSPRETSVARDACARLLITFRPEAALDRMRGRPTVFVRLRAENGRLAGRLDHLLPKPWTPGVVQSYEIRLCPASLATPLAPGRYRLTAGLYEDSWGYRWPLETGAKELDPREYLLGSVTVGPG